jgi:hypothetical protein
MNTGNDSLPAALTLLSHHRESISRMMDHLSDEPGLVAVVLGGSVAKGKARPDSDLDAMVVIGDSAYAQRLERNTVSECVFGKCAYEHGYFDLKYFPISYLIAAAERGSEPTRSSFQGAKLIRSSDPRIDQDLLERIATYPGEEIERKIASFYSAFIYANGFFWGEAKKRDSVYLRTRCASDAVLFGLRLLLVHNRAFFPCHKWLFDAVNQCPQKPDGIAELAAALLRQPEDEPLQRFKDAICHFRDWGPIQKDVLLCLSTVIQDQEQWWWNGRPNLAEW